MYEDGHGHGKDYHDERQDADAQTDGYRLVDISDDRIHILFKLPFFLRQRLFPVLPVSTCREA